MVFERLKAIRLVAKTRMGPMMEERMELGWGTQMVDEMACPMANSMALRF